METNIKKNINLVGKVGKIITTIIIVFTILAGIAATAGTVVVASLPKESVNIAVTGTAEITSKNEVFEKLRKFVELEQKGDGAQLNLANDGDDVDVVLADDDDILTDAQLTETENGFKIDVTDRTMEFSVNRLIYSMIVTLLSIVLTAVTLFMILSLMKSLEKCETPFCTEVITSMKRFGFSLIPFVVLRSITESAWSNLFASSFDFDFNIDLTVVIGILIVFVLTMIFTYGAELQKQSDETL